MKSVKNPNRWIPTEYNCHFDGYPNPDHGNVNSNCEVFYRNTPDASGKFSAIAFKGKGLKASWYFSFKTEESMTSYINNFIELCRKEVTDKITKKLKEKEMNKSVSAKVGDIFVNSWGYDQTNVDAYQVVKVSGSMVELKEIAVKEVDGTSGFMCCQVVPVKNAFRNTEIIKKRVYSYDGKHPYVTFKYGGCSFHEKGKTYYNSWYA